MFEAIKTVSKFLMRTFHGGYSRISEVGPLSYIRAPPAKSQKLLINKKCLWTSICILLNIQLDGCLLSK